MSRVSLLHEHILVMISKHACYMEVCKTKYFVTVVVSVLNIFIANTVALFVQLL